MEEKQESDTQEPSLIDAVTVSDLEDSEDENDSQDHGWVACLQEEGGSSGGEVVELPDSEEDEAPQGPGLHRVDSQTQLLQHDVESSQTHLLQHDVESSQTQLLQHDVQASQTQLLQHDVEASQAELLRDDVVDPLDGAAANEQMAGDKPADKQAAEQAVIEQLVEDEGEVFGAAVQKDAGGLAKDELKKGFVDNSEQKDKIRFLKDQIAQLKRKGTAMMLA